VPGGEKKLPPGAPRRGRLAAVRGRQRYPEGMPGAGREGGGCHEEAAEDAGSGETGAAPAFPTHRLLAGPAERTTVRNRTGRAQPQRKPTGPRQPPSRARSCRGRRSEATRKASTYLKHATRACRALPPDLRPEQPPPCRAWIQQAAGEPRLGTGLGTWPRPPRSSARRAPG